MYYILMILNFIQLILLNNKLCKRKKGGFLNQSESTYSDSYKFYFEVLI